jgi:hypothetical protein
VHSYRCQNEAEDNAGRDGPEQMVLGREWMTQLAIAPTTVPHLVQLVAIAIKAEGHSLTKKRLPLTCTSLTLRSIFASFLLWSSAFRSIPTLSKSSYCCNASMSSAFAANKDARSCSSIVSSTGESSSFSRMGSFGNLFSRLFCCFSTRDFSAPAEAHGIWANISSCDARDLR